MRAARCHCGAGVSVVGLALWCAVSLLAQTFPLRPGPRDFILDEANLINAQDAQQIRTICDKLLTEKRVPIVVVTIPSLAKYGATDIGSYALALFNHWGIGSKDYDYGILLLVSLGDRKARIELGAENAGSKDETARIIMQDIIIPNFKRDDYSTGILQGVQALDTMARGLPVHAPGSSWALRWLMLVGVLVAISLIRSGRKGWGWFLLGALSSIVVGSRRGGSFGGGGGGGGGAIGSW